MGDATHEAGTVAPTSRVHDHPRSTTGFVMGRDHANGVRDPLTTRIAPAARHAGPGGDDLEVAAVDLTALDPAVGADLPILTLRARAFKRSLDLLVGIPLCVAFAIAYPFVAVASKLTSKGPVLFRQVRVGRGGRPIAVYKFRSMSVDAEGRLEADPELYRQYVENGFKIPAAIDPRITRVGRFLRKTSIDELPQALCLLAGSMTVIGPRPILAEQVPVLYKDQVGYYLACKPGLTGLWQVSGRSTVTDDDRADLDVTYATTWTAVGDLRILLRTIPVVLSAHGAH